MKLMRIKGIMPIESGQKQEEYYQAFKTFFKQKYHSLRNFNDYRSCKEYL